MKTYIARLTSKTCQFKTIEAETYEQAEQIAIHEDWCENEEMQESKTEIIESESFCKEDKYNYSKIASLDDQYEVYEIETGKRVAIFFDFTLMNDYLDQINF